MTGTPSRFPNDEYLANLGVVLRWPAGTRLVTPHRFDASWGIPDDDLRTEEVDLTAAAALGDRIARTNTVIRSEYPGGWSEGLIVLQRPSRVRLLVYAVALSPLLLAASAAMLWTNARRAAERSSAAPLELAAALIAILPLRQVLVPADIPGLTRLDYLLSVELVAMIALFALTAAMPGPDTPVTRTSCPPR
jgi:hypothetical protein